MNKCKNISIFLLITIMLVSTFFAYYPGIYTIDSINQWNQVQSNYITNSHPFFSTWFLFLLSKICNEKFVIIFFQIFTIGFFWTSICNYIRNNYLIEKNKIFWLEILMTLLFFVFPINYMYAITSWKDILYSYYLLELSLLLFVGKSKKWQYNYVDIISIVVLLLLILSYRHNGILVSIVIFGIIIVNMFRKKVNFKKIFILIFSFFLLYGIMYIPKKILLKQENHSYDLTFFESYPVFVLSTFFHNNVAFEVQDKKLLNKVMSDEAWKINYDGFLINTCVNNNDINRLFVKTNSSEIFNIMLKYSIKNPYLVIKHYAKSTAMIWSPIPLSYVYVYGFSEWEPLGFENIELSRIPDLRKKSDLYINYSFNNKILKTLFYQPAIYAYLSIVICAFIAFLQKKIDIIYAIIPMILNMISIAIVSVAQDLRYIYLNYLCFFFMLFILVATLVKKYGKELK